MRKEILRNPSSTLDLSPEGFRLGNPAPVQETVCLIQETDCLIQPSLFWPHPLASGPQIDFFTIAAKYVFYHFFLPGSRQEAFGDVFRGRREAFCDVFRGRQEAFVVVIRGMQEAFGVVFREGQEASVSNW